MSSDNKSIGALISELREQANLTQNAFAKLLGTSQSAVARMENGKQNFTTETLSKISNILGKDIIKLSTGSVSFKIDGGYKLRGTVTTNTSKNAAVVLLCASLINHGKTILKKMPRIEEVQRIIEVLVSIGVDVQWVNDDLHISPPEKLNLSGIDKEAADKTRSIIMFIGALIHRYDTFSLPQPGGCKLGSRTIRPHLYALEQLGVSIDTVTDSHIIKVKKLKPADIVMFEAGDTATENAILAAAGIGGTSTIRFASSNYMVQELCLYLTELGVHIDGIGTSNLTIHGLENINKDVVYYPSEDPIDSMLFISLAVTTNSEITIKRAPIDFLKLEILHLEKMGAKFSLSKPFKARNKFTSLVNIKVKKHGALHEFGEKIAARPYPGINSDNLPFFVPVCTQVVGQTLIHDWMYENRAIYYTELNKMGTDMILADPHRVYIKGPTKLRPADITAPQALRPAAIILVAMLAAEGTSTLRNVYSILRGYEDLAARLRKLGAHIEVLRGV